MFWLLLLLPSVIGASLCGECLNGGECLQNRTDPSQFYCRCPIGYFGEQCEVLDYCKNSGFTSPGINPCANGGECKNVTGGFECKCMDVFKGHRCEEDVDECENENVCLNDGVCENRHGSFRCICPNGLTGKHCEINIDDCAENPCQNGAKCIDGVDTFTCECPKGYIGQTCDRLDECFHNNPCVNGNCTLNSKGLPRCECGNEFTGDHCETDVDECLWNPCGGRGQCQNTLGSFKCHCFAGFEGERCDKDIDYCRVERCVNGGSCISQKHGYLCSCVVGFSGTHCEHRDDQNCKLPCENGGRCHNETHCECPNSFKGQFCEIEKPDPCGGNPCVNGGVCLNNRDYNDFVCRCPKGFSGKFCEFKNCNGDQECEMMPYHCNGEQCLNGGTCINLQTGFKCHCQDGFLGHRCELQNSTSVRITAGSDDSDKKGPVLVYLVGDSELVRRHVNEILHTMETSLQVEVKLAKDGDKKPMIYEWDSANGPGQRIDVDLKADSYSEKEMEQDNVVRGVFMMLNVDTTHCKASETQCPKNLVEAAKALMSPTTQRALQPLGIHVKDAEGPQKPESAQKGLWFTVLVVAGLCSLLIISAVNVLTNLNKNKKDPFTGMIKKGSLIYHANSKRNSKSFSASTFIPPMEKPLIPTVQAYDYLQNPSYMQFGGFGHQNYGMIPSNSQSSRIEKPRIITADETKLLPERASAADEIHRWAIEPGTIKSLPEGAQINRPDHVCRTALHWVVEIKEEAESLIDVNFLYHKGADLNAFDMGGDTPLMLAVKTWRNELVVALLALGADPTLVNTQGDTALHLAVQTGNELAVSNLLKCPDIDIELGNEVEDTPLKLSAKVGGPFYGIASKLIDAGAQVDATGDGNKVNGLKRTALHEASLSGSEKIMELLLKNGAQVDAKDSNLQTPLHLAARNKRLESLKLLLKWNANRSFEDIDGFTPLNLAEQQLFDIGVRELIGTAVSSPESLDGISTTQSEKKPLNGTMKKPQAKRKTTHQSDSPPPKLVHVPSSMLSPSSERCTPPQQANPFHQQPTSSHHKPLNLCPQDLGQTYCDYNQKLFYSYPSTNSSNYSSQSDSPDNSTQHPHLHFDPFIPKKSTQIGHFMI